MGDYAPSGLGQERVETAARFLATQDNAKIAVTVEILVGLLDNCGLNLSIWDDLILVTATSTAFHFLLRSSEYLHKGASPNPEKCLRVEHIVCPINGEDESAPQGVPCTEVVLFQPGAKNDWMGQGTSANIYADEDEHPLCVVRLFNLIREVNTKLPYGGVDRKSVELTKDKNAWEFNLGDETSNIFETVTV